MKLELQPLNNVEASSDAAYSWNATTNDPQFAIVGWEHMRGRTVHVSFTLSTGEMPRTPCMLYVDKGDGMSEQNAVWLRVDADGKVDQTMSFPWTLRAVRFDPIAFAGPFSLGDFTLTVDEASLPFGEPNAAALAQSDAAEIAAPALAPTYENWISINEVAAERYPALVESMQQWHRQPLISIVMPTYNSPAQYLRKAIDSVRNQVYTNWELCIADDKSTQPHVKSILDEYAAHDPRIKIAYRTTNGHISAASNSALALATGDFVGLLDHDDELHPLALYYVAELIEQDPQAALIYSDEDKLTVDDRRYEPYFKCDFNYDLFLGQNMISHFGVYKTDILRQIGGFREGLEGSQDYDLALRVIEAIKPGAIRHIPRVLYHWRVLPESTASSVDAKPYAVIAAGRAVQEHLTRCNIAAKVQSADGASMYQRVIYTLPENEPLVEIIIPTRDGAGLVRQCIDSIRNLTTYRNYRITIIDNGSEKLETFELFKSYDSDSRIRVVRDDSPFNYSALNNRVALASSADFVCLLNNDIEVITPDWLSELVSIALQDGVGAVGAKLLYPDDTIQHAGVFLGMGGLAGHGHKHLPRHAPGYFCRAALRNAVSAVTAACLVIRTSIYREVNGLDEGLVVAFNDVDFCLRVREAGYRNVWTPFAELYHHESVSRGYEDTPEKMERFVKEIDFVKNRWGDALWNDPFYSPNLSIDSTEFVITMSPRLANAE
ncbi:glycosyltransferase family 2 protein [Burkholderia cenocepacia]|nr:MULTISPECIES: glycosyltransferase family 2 protein [Burkholderia]AQQ41706.1 glycosyl transferase family 2 [Burkholderia cenocepacia]KVF54608.1 glycosyl transferase family 2 [Burkholderia cenocepacia]MBG0880535.1 glycosyltransferase family 2 protein [Burkholderia sp. 9775_39]MBG0887894.1 glycosyltransferase family 2 protein [Burkholderia sp. 9773_38]MCA8004121.1 glycosyltransferase family 2 protein [Burkholderia cenocepacia]